MLQPTIPDQLLSRLTAIKHSLVENGSVVWRNERDRKPSWRLRVRVPGEGGSVRHLAIALPTEETALTVEGLIRDWRRVAVDQQQEVRAKELADDLNLKMLAYQIVGISRRKCRFIRRQLAKAKAEGPISEWIMVVSEGYRPPVRPVGRPRRRGFSALARFL